MYSIPPGMDPSDEEGFQYDITVHEYEVSWFVINVTLVTVYGPHVE
jgi:hypothetical protein